MSAITTLDHDIIETHILTKLDGITLTSCAAASPMLRTLCTEEKLWKDICTTTWPSIDDPRVRHVISTFLSGYRSFFSDSSTTTAFHTSMPRHHNLTLSELISAVDIRYKNKLVYSKVEVSEDFTSPQLSIDVLRHKETSPAAVQVKYEFDNDKFLLDLEESMSLSWILIDPTQKRSINLSSQKPVSIQINYMTNEVQLLYVTILPRYNRVGSTDQVECRILVTCGGEEGEEMHVREVNMQLQDMNGIILSGEGRVVILCDAMNSERIKQGKGKEIYEMFLEMKRKTRELIARRDNFLDMASTVIRILIFVILLLGVISRYKNIFG